MVNDNPLAKAIQLIFGVFIIYKLVETFITIDPNFKEIIMPIFGAFVFGLIVYFRNKLFK